MAAQTGVTIRILSNKLPTTAAAYRSGAVVSVEKAGRGIEAAAKARVHVITGTLRRSITTAISNGGLTASVGPSVEYGLYEELGSRGRGPHPFMRPAAELVFPLFEEEIAALARKVV